MNEKIEYFGSSQDAIVYEDSPQRFIIRGHDVINGIQRRILSLAIFQKSVVVVFDDPDLHDKSVAESYMDNRSGNIFCFDIAPKVKLAWRIEDLVKEPIHLPFCSGRIAFEEEKSFFARWYGVNFADDHEYYIALNNGGGNYVIDITSEELVKIAYLKN